MLTVVLTIHRPWPACWPRVWGPLPLGRPGRGGLTWFCLYRFRECQRLGGEMSSWPPGAPPGHLVARMCLFASDLRPVTGTSTTSTASQEVRLRPGGLMSCKACCRPPGAVRGPLPSTRPRPPASHRPCTGGRGLLQGPVNKESGALCQKRRGRFPPRPLPHGARGGLWVKEGPPGADGTLPRRCASPAVAAAPPLERGQSVSIGRQPKTPGRELWVTAKKDPVWAASHRGRAGWPGWASDQVRRHN